MHLPLVLSIYASDHPLTCLSVFTLSVFYFLMTKLGKEDSRDVFYLQLLFIILPSQISREFKDMKGINSS